MTKLITTMTMSTVMIMIMITIIMIMNTTISMVTSIYLLMIFSLQHMVYIFSFLHLCVIFRLSCYVVFVMLSLLSEIVKKLVACSFDSFVFYCEKKT